MPLAQVKRIGKAPVTVVVGNASSLDGDIRKAGDGHDRESHGAEILRIHALNSEILDDLVALHRSDAAYRVTIFESLLVKAEARGVDQRRREYVRVLNGEMRVGTGPGADQSRVIDVADVAPPVHAEPAMNGVLLADLVIDAAA